jgi:hypothetical protein
MLWQFASSSDLRSILTRPKLGCAILRGHGINTSVDPDYEERLLNVTEPNLKPRPSGILGSCLSVAHESLMAARKLAAERNYRPPNPNPERTENAGKQAGRMCGRRDSNR